MEATNIISVLAELGTLGVVLIGGGAVYFIMRRNNHKDNGSQQIVEMFVQNQERIAAALERFGTTDERLLDGMTKMENGLDELVKLHIKMEARREVLDTMIDERRKGE